jgi:hypothetical protein
MMNGDSSQGLKEYLCVCSIGPDWSKYFEVIFFEVFRRTFGVCFLCVVFWYFLPVRQLDADLALHPVAGSQLWMWGLKNDSMNDRTTSPLEEQVVGVIPLVPLFTVSF